MVKQPGLAGSIPHDFNTAVGHMVNCWREKKNLVIWERRLVWKYKKQQVAERVAVWPSGRLFG